MKRLEYSSTLPMRYSMASCPMGLSVSGGPKRVFTSCTNCGQVGQPQLSSILCNHNWALSNR